MTAFSEIIGRSTYGMTGFVAGADDLLRAERVLRRSAPVLRRFERVVVATNYGACPEALASMNADLFRSYLPDCTLVDSPVNRGHSIGTSDLDIMLFEHARAAGAEWLCKGATDVLLEEPLLDIEVGEADFYFLNAVSYAAIVARNLDRAPFTHGFLYPQTTFYALRVDSVDFLVDPAVVDRAWERVSAIPDYNGRVWEHIPGWSCEGLLRECALRNSLRRFHLMTEAQWDEVLGLVIERQIEDCSFKGIWINGVCHAQGLDDLNAPVAVIGTR